MWFAVSPATVYCQPSQNTPSIGPTHLKSQHKDIRASSHVKLIMPYNTQPQKYVASVPEGNKIWNAEPEASLQETFSIIRNENL